jgi:hypothetical protein
VRAEGISELLAAITPGGMGVAGIVAVPLIAVVLDNYNQAKVQ